MQARRRVIFTKAGVHAGEDLTPVTARRQRQIATAGQVPGGYGGSAYHLVTQVQPPGRSHA